MSSADVPLNDPPKATTVAAIDLGSNSFRMVIAEVLPDGRIEILERLQRAVRLGQDTFRRGQLGAESMRAAVGVLRDYKQLLKLYSVARIRAVATSAVREATNADNFLDRIFMATGIQVEVIAPSQESRLTVSAVRDAMGDTLAVDRTDVLIADVGGGNTLLTVLHEGKLAASQSLRLGSIRLQEMLLTSEETPSRSAELLRQHIANETTSLRGSLPLDAVRSFVAVGGDARFVAREIGKPTASDELAIVDPAEFDKLVRRCVRHTPEELGKRYGLPFAEVETLNPALLVYQSLLRKTKAEEMAVSRVSMRDGLLLELARDVTGQEDRVLLESVIESATAIGEKYRIDMEHASHVADLAVRLFDELQADHGLGARHRLLLRVAGLLHEAGGFVSTRAHHKHSYYLISNAEIFGLGPDEIAIVAQIARYHRHSPPKRTHPEFMALSRETRVAVSKLAALLRMADALIRGHARRAADFRFERRGDELTIYLPGAADLLLEDRAVAAKGDLFEDIYGIKVRLESA